MPISLCYYSNKIGRLEHHKSRHSYEMKINLAFNQSSTLIQSTQFKAKLHG